MPERWLSLLRTGGSQTPEPVLNLRRNIHDSENIKLVVLYNAATVDKSKCPDAIKAYGTHAPMQKMKDGKHYWDYQSVKNAMGLS